MKVVAASTVLAVALIAAAGSAHAGTYVSVTVAAPGFGVSIASPVYAPIPAVPVVLAPPVVIAPPVYVPPLPVTYVPPRLVVGAPVLVPVAVPYGFSPAAPHRNQGHRKGSRGWAPVAAYPYGRY